ncbi:S26 family signal peptidase [Nonomuraea sp. NPDC049504]|uniref:S26 family signal peptidase n=1 Tax=Nonomuraea sp. NPDC049504 TaxID=3154729 RepID=UPI00343AD817
MIPLSLLTALVLTIILVRRTVVIVTVSGTSMTPTLRPGEKLLVRRCELTALKVGDIVVLGPPRIPVSPEVTALAPLPARTRWQVKRVAALPGDPIPEPARKASGTLRTVPDGTLIVLGDNKASHDSRLAGPYPATHLLGRTLRKLSTPI